MTHHAPLHEAGCIHAQVLGSNRLAELPLSIAALPKLARLDLSANLLVTVPPALGHIKTFKELDLRCCWLVLIPLACFVCIHWPVGQPAGHPCPLRWGTSRIPRSWTSGAAFDALTDAVLP